MFKLRAFILFALFAISFANEDQPSDSNCVWQDGDEARCGTFSDDCPILGILRCQIYCKKDMYRGLKDAICEIPVEPNSGSVTVEEIDTDSVTVEEKEKSYGWLWFLVGFLVFVCCLCVCSLCMYVNKSKCINYRSIFLTFYMTLD